MAEPQTTQAMLAALQRSQQTFLEVLAQVEEAALYRRPAEDSWTLAETLVHMAEARQFFVGETGKVLAAPGSRVGRTMEHEGRLKNIAEHGRDSLEVIRRKLVASHEALVSLLSQISDADLQLECEHIRFGPQRLAEFMQRFIVGHDQAHAEQAQTFLLSD